jgi:hypothetical protein
MAEVRVSHLYKVTMTEYESGWGQRPMGTKFFDNEAEAREYVRAFNARNTEIAVPDWYMIAEFRGRI